MFIKEMHYQDASGGPLLLQKRGKTASRYPWSVTLSDFPLCPINSRIFLG